MIHVCYTMRDDSGKYSKFVGTSICSLLENTHEDVTIHLFHDSTLSNENLKKFKQIVYSNAQEIIFYNIDELAAEILEEIKQKYLQMVSVNHTIAVFYRHMIPDLISENIDKIIYLDADIIVNLDIAELWAFDLDKKTIAASPEFFSGNDLWVKDFAPCRDGFVDWKDYFNTGVIVFDLKQLRSIFGGGGQLLKRELTILKEHPNFNIPEQDACNFLFREDFQKLPIKFNHIVPYAKYKGINEIARHIYHYVTRTNDLNLNSKFSRLWFEYFVRTPFCDAQAFGNLFNEFQNFMRNRNQILQRIIQLSTNRKRAFFIDPHYTKFVTDFFGASEGDIIINFNNPNALINLMKKESRLILIFMAQNYFQKLKSQLEESNFKENEDFFNAYELITNQEFIPNSYNFVKEM